MIYAIVITHDIIAIMMICQHTNQGNIHSQEKSGYGKSFIAHKKITDFSNERSVLIVDFF